MGAGWGEGHINERLTQRIFDKSVDRMLFDSLGVCVMDR